MEPSTHRLCPARGVDGGAFGVLAAGLVAGLDFRGIEPAPEYGLHIALASAVLHYFRQRIATDEDPRRFGKSLSHELTGQWRYRVRDYRMICNIEDNKLVVLVLRVGTEKIFTINWHRKMGTDKRTAKRQ